MFEFGVWNDLWRVTMCSNHLTVSRQNGQVSGVDKWITLSHSASSCGVRNPINRPFGRSHQSEWSIAAVAVALWL